MKSQSTTAASTKLNKPVLAAVLSKFTRQQLAEARQMIERESAKRKCDNVS